MSDNGTCDVPRLTLAYMGVKGKTVDNRRKTKKNRSGTKIVKQGVGSRV